MSKYEIAKTVIDKCNTDIIDMSLLEPITKEEHVSECLNREFSSYGLNIFVSLDKTSVFIDDQGMSQVINYFEGTVYQPVVTEKHVERVKNIIESADK
jgi:predicted Zn-dependent peptidase